MPRNTWLDRPSLAWRIPDSFLLYIVHIPLCPSQSVTLTKMLIKIYWIKLLKPFERIMQTFTLFFGMHI